MRLQRSSQAQRIRPPQRKRAVPMPHRRTTVASGGGRTRAKNMRRQNSGGPERWLENGRAATLPQTHMNSTPGEASSTRRRVWQCSQKRRIMAITHTPCTPADPERLLIITNRPQMTTRHNTLLILFLDVFQFAIHISMNNTVYCIMSKLICIIFERSFSKIRLYIMQLEY